MTVLTAQNSWQKPIGAQIENVGHLGGEMVFILSDLWVITNHKKTDGEPHNIFLRQELRAIYARHNEWPAGKEVVLVDSFLKPGELLLVELFRFDDQGNKKLLFQDDKLMMRGKDEEKVEWTVLRRFATWQGFSNLWDSMQREYKDRKIIVFPASEGIDHVEETKPAIWQQHVLQDLYDLKQELMHCLHCGQMISTNDSYIVEIDEIGLQPNVGNVHARCMRIADRILGKTRYADLKETENLLNFDYKKWTELVETGQGMVWQTKLKTSQYERVDLYWNQDHSFNTGEYCIRLHLSNGKYEYMTLGQGIHRFATANVDKDLALIREQIQLAFERKDPFGWASEQKQFGIKSQLQKNKRPTCRLPRTSATRIRVTN